MILYFVQNKNNKVPGCFDFVKPKKKSKQKKKKSETKMCVYEYALSSWHNIILYMKSLKHTWMRYSLIFSKNIPQRLIKEHNIFIIFSKSIYLYECNSLEIFWMFCVCFFFFGGKNIAIVYYNMWVCVLF